LSLSKHERTHFLLWIHSCTSCTALAIVFAKGIAQQKRQAPKCKTELMVQTIGEGEGGRRRWERGSSLELQNRRRRNRSLQTKQCSMFVTPQALVTARCSIIQRSVKITRPSFRSIHARIPVLAV